MTRRRQECLPAVGRSAPPQRKTARDEPLPYPFWKLEAGGWKQEKKRPERVSLDSTRDKCRTSSGLKFEGKKKSPRAKARGLNSLPSPSKKAGAKHLFQTDIINKTRRAFRGRNALFGSMTIPELIHPLRQAQDRQDEEEQKKGPKAVALGPLFFDSLSPPSPRPACPPRRASGKQASEGKKPPPTLKLWRGALQKAELATTKENARGGMPRALNSLPS